MQYEARIRVAGNFPFHSTVHMSHTSGRRADYPPCIFDVTYGQSRLRVFSKVGQVLTSGVLPLRWITQMLKNSRILVVVVTEVTSSPGIPKCVFWIIKIVGL